MANKSIIIIPSSITSDSSFESLELELSDSESWQVIDPSDSDDDTFSFSDVTTTDTDHDDDVIPDVDDLLQHPYHGSPSSDTSMQSLVDQIQITHHQMVEGGEETVEEGGLMDGGDDEYEEDQNNDDDVDDDDDLDDELVPKWLSNKFERQRMRKLGKRAYSKIKKSKRHAYVYDNKRGCVHGKRF